MTAPLDSRQLRAFSILAETGSFTETARRLHLSQSASSHAIKALEEEVGCRLLDRVGKKVILTQAGEQLLAHANKILETMASARGELEHLGKWGRSRLRIGAITTACEHILPGVFREFKESFPACSIHIETGDTPHLLDMLRNHRIDLALAMEPRQEELFEFRSLFTDELKFLVGPLHPWAIAGRVNGTEITNQNYIVYRKGSYTEQMVVDYFKEDNRVLQSTIEIGSMVAIKEMVKIGIGVSILAPWIAKKELNEKSLVALPLGRRKLRRHWGILYSRYRHLSLAEETFVGLCKSFTDNLGNDE